LGHGVVTLLYQTSVML